MHYVQRFEAPGEPGLVADRLVHVLADLGFHLEGAGNLPCAKFARGNPANSLIAFGPQFWGATIDARVEPAAEGGSKVDLAWSVTYAGQLKGKADMAYWRAAFKMVRGAAMGEQVDRTECKRFANHAVWANVLGTPIIVAAILADLLFAPGLLWKCAGLLVVCALILPFVEFKPLSE